MQEKSSIQRPLCLELVDAKKEIFDTINMVSRQKNIPYYLLESIVNEAASQVANCARIERENAAREYAAQQIKMEDDNHEEECI